MQALIDTWSCVTPAPLQLFVDPRGRERVLVPLVVQEPWQALQAVHSWYPKGYQHVSGQLAHVSTPTCEVCHM